MVSCGKAELIYSNRICCYDDKQVDFKVKINDTIKDDLKIRFVFIHSNGEKPNIKTKNNAKAGVIFELTNFDNPLGAGLKKPLTIAKVNDDVISIMFNVYKYIESNPTLDISLYLEKRHGK